MCSLNWFAKYPPKYVVINAHKMSFGYPGMQFIGHYQRILTLMRIVIFKRSPDLDIICKAGECTPATSVNINTTMLCHVAFENLASISLREKMTKFAKRDEN